jgi:hypothetical protein
MSTPLNEELDRLLVLIRQLAPMTQHEQEEQQMCFAYGNLAASTNHKPTYRAFQSVALFDLHWTVAEFNAWAAERAWWVR